jgi:hypothetical protein
MIISAGLFFELQRIRQASLFAELLMIVKKRPSENQGKHFPNIPKDAVKNRILSMA